MTACSTITSSKVLKGYKNDLLFFFHKLRAWWLYACAKNTVVIKDNRKWFSKYGVNGQVIDTTNHAHWLIHQFITCHWTISNLLYLNPPCVLLQRCFFSKTISAAPRVCSLLPGKWRNTPGAGRWPALNIKMLFWKNEFAIVWTYFCDSLCPHALVLVL